MVALVAHLNHVVGAVQQQPGVARQQHRVTGPHLARPACPMKLTVPATNGLRPPRGQPLARFGAAKVLAIHPAHPDKFGGLGQLLVLFKRGIGGQTCGRDRGAAVQLHIGLAGGEILQMDLGHLLDEFALKAAHHRQPLPNFQLRILSAIGQNAGGLGLVLPIATEHQSLALRTLLKKIIDAKVFQQAREKGKA